MIGPTVRQFWTSPSVIKMVELTLTNPKSKVKFRELSRPFRQGEALQTTVFNCDLDYVMIKKLKEYCKNIKLETKKDDIKLISLGFTDDLLTNNI